ncbi:MAG: hypothetical protein ACRCXX_12600, partial [Cetobacterium sp.]|uniref:hypothetical protein n=1 Tax=Cetobacterium sp. TaxID=2071632 RepID=UPI003F2E0FAB
NLPTPKMLWYTLETNGEVTIHTNEVGAKYEGSGIMSIGTVMKRITVSAMRVSHDRSFGLGIFANVTDIDALYGFQAYAKANVTLQTSTCFRANKIIVRALGMLVGDYSGGFVPKENIAQQLSTPSTKIDVNCTVFM